jgi:predicted CopG family antitoxin
MNSKLTLSIQKDVIEIAKEYAKKQNRSLSDIIENYLKLITKNEQMPSSHELDPLIESLMGAFKAPADFNYKEELAKRREDKYL